MRKHSIATLQEQHFVLRGHFPSSSQIIYDLIYDIRYKSLFVKCFDGYFIMKRYMIYYLKKDIVINKEMKRLR